MLVGEETDRKLSRGLGENFSRRVLLADAIGGVSAVLSACAQAPLDVSPRSTRSEQHLRPTVTPQPSGAPVFDSHKNSIDDPESIWVVVNKARPLNPLDYVPTNLVYPNVPYVNRQPMRPEAAEGITQLFAAAQTEAGLALSVQSAYRSCSLQTSVYEADVAAHGQAFADADTARSGHSEHQTGLAIDISSIPAACTLQACFGQTPHGQWLATNAWRWGFLLRYQPQNVAVIGFTYEPWHFRYIGLDLTEHLHQIGITTLEEFFGVPGGPNYPAA